MSEMVKNGWKGVKLGEVFDFLNGKAIKAQQEGIFKVYGANGVIGKSNEYKYENAIIIGRVGAYCGAVEYEKEKFWASDNTVVAKPKQPNTELFCFYLLRTLPLNFSAGGSAQPLLTQTILKDIDVEIPKDTTTQRKIASILYAYDDLIENNICRIKILEEMAQAIYREWFVNFRFPGYEKVKMVESELGLIPEGWEIKSVRDLVKRLKAGNTYTQNDVLPFGNVPVVDQSRDEFKGSTMMSHHTMHPLQIR